MKDFDDTITDPQLRYYYDHPDSYIRTAKMIDICMRIGDRRCTGSGCDEGRPCPRHARSAKVAKRYLAMKDRKR